MNIEEALAVLDTALEENFLNDIQELVFRQSWLGQTYLEMAEISGYNANYIKDVGYKLWKLVSKVFQEEVTKSNFRSVLRRQYLNFKNARASVETIQEKPADASTLTDGVLEAESFKMHTQNINTGVNQKPNQQEELAGNINSSNQIDEQIATPKIVINTVVAALDKQQIKQNQKTANNILTVIPQAINPKETTAKTHQSFKEAVDLLTSYEYGTEINLLKQWIRDDRYCLVAVLASRDEVISH